MNKKYFWSGLFVGIISAAFIAGCILCFMLLKVNVPGIQGRNSSSNQTQAQQDVDSVLELPQVEEKIRVLEDAIEEYYIEDVTVDEIERGIYDGIMSSLNDPYAMYYTPEEWQEMISSTQGIYYGIGAYLMKNQTTLYPQITGFISDSPAEESELCVNDFIYKIDGVDVYDLPIEDVVSMIKGEEGTKVTLTVIREDTREELDVTLERRRVESPTVEYEILEKENGKIGYISIAEFDDVTVDQFAEALAVVKGNQVDGIVLDLRGNPGGSLTAVVEIAQQILPQGLVVYTEDKYGVREEYSCDGRHELDLPLVVLVNGGSASASEILAGAIKDYEIGTLLGTTTYGKGIVQRLVSLRDGSAIKLTVSHYYTPLGNDIHKIGIEPDVVVEFDAEAYRENEYDNQLEEAIQMLLE